MAKFIEKVRFPYNCNTKKFVKNSGLGLGLGLGLGACSRSAFLTFWMRFPYCRVRFPYSQVPYPYSALFLQCAIPYICGINVEWPGNSPMMLSFDRRSCLTTQFSKTQYPDFFMNFLFLRFPYIFARASVFEQL